MKNKYVFGGFIIVVFLGLLGYLLTQSNIKYEEDFTKVKEETKMVKATGQWVKEKYYEINKKDKTFSFYLADAKGVEMKVLYNGTIPNNFESAVSVVVTGEYRNGYFHAKDILTKCPSKYEEQYEEEKTKTSSI
ncbi:MAG: cytochrome C biogenesis protein [Ignavibacteria bacterium GWA2_35_9]|nr:MAG: cytochrome C biogenesis protein [Ignavibacteria bacterium GWA2_35_9]OGU50010.1 MAG: cytochrome C biogenesis protein [Ignavibacteria bacterium GWC2_36_12]